MAACQFEKRAEIHGLYKRFQECRESQRIHSSGSVQFIQSIEGIADVVEKTGKLLGEYRDDGEQYDEEKEENAQEDRNETEPIGNPLFVHPIQKDREKHRQKTGKEEYGEDGCKQ